MEARTIANLGRLVAACGGNSPASSALSASALVAAACFALWPRPAGAVDGCLVLLCLAAPSWSAIPQCVPPVRQLFRDLARGRPFPSCTMSGGGNSANNRWSTAPSFCPPQYTRVYEAESGPVYTCDYAGAVSVNVNGELFARTWWNMGGDAVTEFAAPAKSMLGSWDTRFDDDYARWVAMFPPMTPTEPNP